MARGAFFAVADGHGSDGAGRHAARIAVETLGTFFQLPPEDFSPGAGLRATFERISGTLDRLATQAPSAASATTTLSAVYTAPTLDRGILITIGDSPVYAMHRGKLTLLSTQSHTVDARLGPGQTPSASHRSLRLSDEDVLLLCTRGVSDTVPQAALAERLAALVHPADAASDIVDLALQGGATDDATALVVRFGACPARRPADECEGDVNQRRGPSRTASVPPSRAASHAQSARFSG